MSCYKILLIFNVKPQFYLSIYTYYISMYVYMYVSIYLCMYITIYLCILLGFDVTPSKPTVMHRWFILSP